MQRKTNSRWTMMYINNTRCERMGKPWKMASVSGNSGTIHYSQIGLKWTLKGSLAQIILRRQCMTLKILSRHSVWQKLVIRALFHEGSLRAFFLIKCIAKYLPNCPVKYCTGWLQMGCNMEGVLIYHNVYFNNYDLISGHIFKPRPFLPGDCVIVFMSWTW